MNSKIITCKNELSYIESVGSCPSERASCPLFPCLSPPCVPGLRATLILSTSSLLILALLSLPFTLLCKTHFLPITCLCVHDCFLSENISTFKGALQPSLALSLAGLPALKAHLSLAFPPFLSDPMVLWLNCVPLKKLW